MLCVYSQHLVLLLLIQPCLFQHSLLIHDSLLLNAPSLPPQPTVPSFPFPPTLTNLHLTISEAGHQWGRYGDPGRVYGDLHLRKFATRHLYTLYQPIASELQLLYSSITYSTWLRGHTTP